MNIAILGFGTVGSGIYEILKKNKGMIKERAGEEINVKYILDIRDFSSHEDAHLFTKDYNTILNDDSVPVVAEVIGGLHPALDFTKMAIMAGKSVITSNKELVAAHGAEIFALAAENNASYLFEASVGGGIPLIRPLYKCLAANKITKIMGILNGTTNYILSKMINEGKSFDETLLRAQEKGYAERNPEADIKGHDTCRKIAILCSLASGKQVNSEKIKTEGITDIDLNDVKYAEKAGAVIKLIGYGEITEHGVYARVSPMLIPADNPLACASNVFNAAMLTGDSVGDVMFYGRGAGKMPTASAVIGDIIDIARHSGCFMRWDASPADFIADENILTGAFLRIADEDRAEFEKNYSYDVSFKAGIEGETGYFIKSISEKNLQEIKAVKIIRAESELFAD